MRTCLTSKKVSTNTQISEICNKHHAKWGNGFPFQLGTDTVTTSIQLRWGWGSMSIGMEETNLLLVDMIVYVKAKKDLQINY